MRVTKDIREYVERIIRQDGERKARALERPATNMEKEKKEYYEWAENRFEEISQMLKEEALEKIAELGLSTKKPEQYNRFGYEQYIRNNSLEDSAESYIKYLFDKQRVDIIGMHKYLDDAEMAEYNKKYHDLMHGWHDKAQEILVGLEIGDINKKELDTVLAPYKG